MLISLPRAKGRPTSYFDLHHSSQPVALTPRPPSVAVRPSQDHLSATTRDSATESSGSIRPEPSRRRNVPSSSAGPGAVANSSGSSSPVRSPTRSPLPPRAASLFAPIADDVLSAPTHAVRPIPDASGGSRTPRSFPAWVSVSPRSPRLRSASPPGRPSSPSPAWTRPSLILTREEEEVLGARFDLMSDAELAAVHARWEAEQALTGASSSAASSPSGTVPEEPPLFPEASSVKDHPLRVLARACRKLYRAEREGQRGTQVEPASAPVAGVKAPEPNETQHVPPSVRLVGNSDALGPSSLRLQSELYDALSTTLATAPVARRRPSSRRSSTGISEQPSQAASMPSAFNRAFNAASMGWSSSKSVARSSVLLPKASSLVEAPAEVEATARSGDGSLLLRTTSVPSVELDSIEPQESRPPTLVSDRRGLRRLFSAHRTASDAAKVARQTSRFAGGGKLEPLTDQYGFIYNTRNLALLREASDAGAPAPAVFAGLPRVEPEGGADDEDVEEDWVEDNIVLCPGEMSRRPTSSGARTPASAEMQLSGSSASGVSISFVEGSQMLSSASVAPRSNGRHRSSTILSLNPSPARPSAAPQAIHASADVMAVGTDQSLPSSHRQTFGLTGRKVCDLLSCLKSPRADSRPCFAVLLDDPAAPQSTLRHPRAPADGAEGRLGCLPQKAPTPAIRGGVRGLCWVCGDGDLGQGGQRRSSRVPAARPGRDPDRLPEQGLARVLGSAGVDGSWRVRRADRTGREGGRRIDHAGRD